MTNDTRLYDIAVVVNDQIFELASEHKLSGSETILTVQNVLSGIIAAVITDNLVEGTTVDSFMTGIKDRMVVDIEELIESTRNIKVNVDSIDTYGDEHQEFDIDFCPEDLDLDDTDATILEFPKKGKDHE